VLTLATFGMQPFGSIQSGTLASLVGPQFALIVGGCVCVLCAIFIWVRWPAMSRLT
jgi:hypothetical protein